MLKSAVAGALVGLLHGGLPAARDARQRYIQLSQAELYTSRVEAVVRRGGGGRAPRTGGCFFSTTWDVKLK